MQQEGVDICVIGERLKTERERLGLAQPAFAEIAGAAKRTLIDWEKGVSSPTAVQLAALAGAGVDVLFVLTGERSKAIAPSAALPPRQRALLDNYEHSDEAGKKVIEGAAVLAAQSPKKAAKGGQR
ncbi:helix-turn-helix domain-containing protein [Delftia lacustris]